MDFDQVMEAAEALDQDSIAAAVEALDRYYDENHGASNNSIDARVAILAYLQDQQKARQRVSITSRVPRRP